MDKITMAVAIISNQVKNGADLQEQLNTYQCPAGLGTLSDTEKDDVKVLVKNKLDFQRAMDYAEVEDPALIIDIFGHEEWYGNWLTENTNNHTTHYYWLTLKRFLEDQLQTKYSAYDAGEIVKSIDVASTKVIGRMESPSRYEFSTKGLVVGHVQSGKTANFTAVIAKAVDAGYRLIIVLTGIHSNLRAQTQTRLDKELTGEPGEQGLSHVDVPPMEYRQWVRTTDHERDFDQMKLSKLEVYASGRRPILVVMKKNCPVMDRFITWVEKAPEEIRMKIPLLLIDDEADQASIDTNYSKDTDPTETNQRIRKIIGEFPRNVYVGYTATPFANLLIDMNITHSNLGPDLYPRNFIVSLPRPKGYMGAEQVFTQGCRKHYVREIPPDEVALYNSSRAAQARRSPSQITPNLEKAILAFCLSGAAMFERGKKGSPMTMLIHTTHLQAGHQRIKSLVEPFCKSLKARWEDINERVILEQTLQDLWNRDFVPTTTELYPERVRRFDQIEPFIGEFFNELKVFELNSSAEDELDYTKHPQIKVVAIGGNRLSRGLTLEGLMTSFYLRASKAYDTLLQMGRWFGYRQHYEDLVRVYSSKRLADWFEDLAMVEEELRKEIYRYEDEELTPAQVSVHIRAHQNMKITAKNKMGAAGLAQCSFSGSLVQTIWFLLDKPDVLRQNFKIGEQLIKNIQGWRRKKDDTISTWLAKKVNCNVIMEFLNAYVFENSQAGLDSENMKKYIKRHTHNELKHWNVSVASHKGSYGYEAVSFGDLSVYPVNRSRHQKTKYKIGVISDPSDLVIDLDQQGSINKDPHKNRRLPLLVLYIISKDSAPKHIITELEPLFKDLDEKENVLGFAIVFPKSKSEPYGYVAQPDGKGLD